MKILFVVHGFPPESVAGTEIVSYHLARALRDRGHEVMVFHRGSDPDSGELSMHRGTVDGMEVVGLVNNLQVPTVLRSYHRPEVESAFLDVVREFEPDVVHFQHALHLSASLIPLCGRQGFPTVVTLHDYWFICPTVQLIRPDGSLCQGPEGGFGCFRCVGRKEPGAAQLAAFGTRAPALVRPMLRAAATLARRYTPFAMAGEALALVERPAYMRGALASADLVISPSRFLVEMLRRNGIESTRIVQSANGTPAARLGTVRKSPSDVVRFTYAGTLIGYKGVHVLLEAMRSLPRGRATLNVYGDTTTPEAVREYSEHVRPLAASTDTRFRGRFQPDELPRILAETDVMVVPSLWYENAPVAILEAFATRTPVIASNIGGMAELVAHDLSGLLFRHGDPADLAKQMVRLVDNPPEIERLAQGIGPVKDMETSALEHEAFYARAREARGSRTLPT